MDRSLGWTLGARWLARWSARALAPEATARTQQGHNKDTTRTQQGHNTDTTRTQQGTRPSIRRSVRSIEQQRDVDHATRQCGGGVGGSERWVKLMSKSLYRRRGRRRWRDRRVAVGRRHARVVGEHTSVPEAMARVASELGLRGHRCGADNSERHVAGACVRADLDRVHRARGEHVGDVLAEEVAVGRTPGEAVAVCPRAEELVVVDVLGAQAQIWICEWYNRKDPPPPPKKKKKKKSAGWGEKERKRERERERTGKDRKGQWPVQALIRQARRREQ